MRFDLHRFKPVDIQMAVQRGQDIFEVEPQPKGLWFWVDESSVADHELHWTLCASLVLFSPP